MQAIIGVGDRAAADGAVATQRQRPTQPLVRNPFAGQRQDVRTVAGVGRDRQRAGIGLDVGGIEGQVKLATAARRQRGANRAGAAARQVIGRRNADAADRHTATAGIRQRRAGNWHIIGEDRHLAKVQASGHEDHTTVYSFRPLASTQREPLTKQLGNIRCIMSHPDVI